MSSEAEALWRKACNLDDEGRLDKAIQIYERAVVAGSTDAMVNLALIYEERTSPPRFEEAIALYERAATAGNSIAAWNLHRHYELLGRQAESGHWLKVASELGDEDATALLYNR